MNLVEWLLFAAAVQVLMEHPPFCQCRNCLASCAIAGRSLYMTYDPKELQKAVDRIKRENLSNGTNFAENTTCARITFVVPEE